MTRSAEECAATLTSVVNTDQCLHVLGPIIATAQFPVCLAAIKMATKAIEQAPREVVLSQLKNLVPGVLKVILHYKVPILYQFERAARLVIMPFLFRVVS